MKYCDWMAPEAGSLSVGVTLCDMHGRNLGCPPDCMKEFFEQWTMTDRISFSFGICNIIEQMMGKHMRDSYVPGNKMLMIVDEGYDSRLDELCRDYFVIAYSYDGMRGEMARIVRRKVCTECGHAFDDNDTKSVCKTCEDWS